MSKVTRLYFSREARVGELGADERRMQHQNPEEDADRLKAMRDQLFDVVEELDDKLAMYETQMCRGSSEDELKQARADAIETWTMAQVALSGVAWVMRFNADEAFNRICEYAKYDRTYNMGDL